MLTISLLLSGPIDARKLFEAIRDWSPWHPPRSASYDPYLRSEFVNDDALRRGLWIDPFLFDVSGVLLVLDLRRDSWSGEMVLTVRPHRGVYWWALGLFGLAALTISVWLMITSHPNESSLRGQLFIWGCYLAGSGIVLAELRKTGRRVARVFQANIEQAFGIASRLV